MIRYNDKDLGVLGIDDVKFPEQKGRYLSLDLSITEVCGLAIENAKRYQSIRDDKGYWNQVEAYIQKHSDAKFSHGICQDCMQLYYADYIPKKKE